MHVYKLNIVQKKKRKKRNAQLLLDKTKDTELSQALARSERINKSCTTLEHTERSAQNESRKRETICRLAAPKCTRTHACVRACVYKQQQQSCINISWLKQRTQTKGRGGPAPECDRVVVGQPGKGLPITACIFPPMHVLPTSPTLARVSSYLTFVFLFTAFFFLTYF